MRVIKEGAVLSPLHIIYKVIDFRLWKGTEEPPPPPHNKKALY
jgi:hypothetical protein